MRSKNKPIKVALYGMDHRTCKALGMYLSGPCKGIAIVVEPSESDVDILDADYIKAGEILEQRKSQKILTPLIVLSIEEVNIEGTIYVKKPIQTIELVSVFKVFQTTLKLQQSLVSPLHSKEVPKIKNDDNQEINKEEAPKTEEVVKNRNKAPSNGDRKRNLKHRTAMDITEANYTNLIGSIEGINFNCRSQMLKASHNPNEYFLGYVNSAIMTAKKERKELLINSHWKPIMISPDINEIWVDSSEIQLRAFANLPLTIIEEKGKLSLSPIDLEHAELAQKADCFNDIDTFLWKLAIWTSKGRYPEALDVNQPVYLMHWPNFTRLLITPHAIRIAALLIEGPRSPINIADALKIQPHFVFVFISAAHAIGLVGQAVRQVDSFIEPLEIKKPKAKTGLLSRILSKLRT